jgi:two-component system chemotaxis response regulator CheB
MPKIRILVVDDAVVIRRLVSDELAKDPLLEVVGTASNGRIALAKLPQLSPDLVILDIEMPELDGLATLKELRKTYPRLPVIMFSALTERGAAATLDALALGASDYFTKPANVTSLDASLEIVREKLIPKIKALVPHPGGGVPSGDGKTRSDSISGGQLRIPPRPPPVHRSTPHVLAIGASTGGPNALAEVFKHLPAAFPLPIVIVQHMPAMFTRLLAERLTAEYPIRVQEGATGSKLQPGQAWIAPGDHHMTVVREGIQVRLKLNQEPPENSCRPAVDVLLRSVAQTFGPNSLTVILTGMGQDGLRGCEAIRDAGGQIFVQDQASSVVWGMPGYVARASLADKVVPLAQIADEILARVPSAR